MTRGKMVLLSDDTVISTIEFNGDMYPSGNGGIAYKALEKVKSEEDLRKAAMKLNERYGYNEPLVWSWKYADDLLDMSTGYFDKWFSDYLYIKNGGDQSACIVERNGDEFELKPGEVVVLNFGRVVPKDEVLEELTEEEPKIQVPPITVDIQKDDDGFDLYISDDSGSGVRYVCKTVSDVKERVCEYIEDTLE